MANLKKSIKQALKNKRYMDFTLNNLSKSQENLLKNHSNLVFKYDQYTYVHTHKVSIEEAIADSERDQVANRLGRERGRKYPNCNCATLLHDLLPDYKK